MHQAEPVRGPHGSHPTGLGLVFTGSSPGSLTQAYGVGRVEGTHSEALRILETKTVFSVVRGKALCSCALCNLPMQF